MKIVVVNQKGGPGKSTVVMCLASILAQANAEVVIKDMDPQGSLKLWARHIGNVPLYGEIPNPAFVLVDTAGRLDLNSFRSRAIKELVKELEEADRVLLVSDLDYFTLNATATTAEFVKGYCEKSYILWNKVQERTVLGQQNRDELAKSMGLPALKHYLKYSASYRNAASEGWGAVTGKEREAVFNIAMEVIGK